MSLACGLIGLPNVGKSTLFSAVSGAAAGIADYPFCTVDPNVAEAPIPDPRLDALADIAKSRRIVPARLKLIDIAGLVPGAAKGEGLGNRFLSHIREVDAVVHVIRCFDGETSHTQGRVDPVGDLQLIETELLLADIESLQNRLKGVRVRAQNKDPVQSRRLPSLENALQLLENGTPLRQAMTPTLAEALIEAPLITALPTLYVANVEEDAVENGNRHSRNLEEWAERERQTVIRIAARTELDLQSLPAEEQTDFRKGMGLETTGLDGLLLGCARLLGLRSFFTVGPKETHAWLVPAPGLAPDAAGRVHSDMKKGFIRAETIAYDDYIQHGGEAGARAAGLMRLEGKAYRVADGDVMHFRFAT